MAQPDPSALTETSNSEGAPERPRGGGGSDPRVPRDGGSDESGLTTPTRDDSPPPLEDQEYYDSGDYDDEDRGEFYYDPADYGSDVHVEDEYEEEPVGDEGEPQGPYEEVADEEDIDTKFTNPNNLKVEYIGKHRMLIMDKEVDDSFLTTDEPGAVSRLVVIDAANILHGLTPLMDTANNSVPELGEQKVDAAYILSLVRFFVSKGIECMVVTLHKYMLDSVTDNTFIMRTLQELGLLMVMDKTYDDLVLFSVASEFDAVIVTEDCFRSEKQRKEFMTPNVVNALQLRVSPIYPRVPADFLPKEEWGTVSRNGHFVVDHLMRFEGSTEVLRKKFFSSPSRGGHRFELVEEKYQTWLRRKDEVLTSLDALLAKIQPVMQKVRENVPQLLPRST